MKRLFYFDWVQSSVGYPMLCLCYDYGSFKVTMDWEWLRNYPDPQKVIEAEIEAWVEYHKDNN